MTKTQLLDALSESTGLNKKDVASVLEQLGVVIERHVKRRAVGTFTLPGLLKIKVVRKPATKARRNRAAIFSHPMSPVSGNPKGDVTLVEFFDYQCSYCTRSLKPMKDLLASDRKLRVVWKEFPILGPVSRFAARAAMAADKQGRYLDFHVAVMGARGKLTEASVIATAGRLGLDVERLRRDMRDPAIENYLNETIGLARKLGIGGTPAFVIGDMVVPTVGTARLRQLIADVRGG